MNRSKNELISLLENVPLLLVGVLLFFFPLLFSIQTTEAFLLPKQLFLGALVTVAMIALGLRIFLEGKLRVRTTPFDLPVLAFAVIVFLSGLFSINRYDALVASVSFLYAAVLFYVIVNAVKSQKGLLFLLSTLVAGSALASLLTVFSFFNLYLLPLPYAKSPYFTTFGTLFDQALYLAMVLPICGYFALQLVRGYVTKGGDVQSRKPGTKTLLFTIATLIIGLGFGVTVYYLLTSQRPIILPFADGFQIAFASISQDAGRILKGFLLGSGYGTFLTDFTRFKQASYNGYESLWSVTFLRSSSFVLELLATTGILGLLSFFAIVFKIVRERTVFLPLILATIAAFLFPFSPLLITLFFVLLGIFAAVRAQSGAEAYADVEIHLVALRQGLLEAREEHHAPARGKYNRLLPGMFFLVLALLVGVSAYYTAMFGLSDITFQKSLVAASQNNGTATYNLQRSAIGMFPFRDSYHRVFAQTNLALANTLAQQTPQGSTPSAQTQQNVLALIQQSINSGRSATAIAPYTAVNWNNLSSVYRAMVGFGQNAEQFAVLTNQQAIALDPNNPQQYVNLGGIYYQLGLWDDSARQFQIAINLKPDYANAYYNLGHALESRGNLPQALSVYQVVRNLVAKDKDNADRIGAEMDALEKKIGEQQVASATTEAPTEQPEVPADEDAAKQPLDVNKPANTLPERNPKAKIPGPTISPLPSPTGAAN